MHDDAHKYSIASLLHKSMRDSAPLVLRDDVHYTVHALHHILWMRDANNVLLSAEEWMLF